MINDKPDNILQQVVDATPIGTKVVASRYNPKCIPSRYNPVEVEPDQEPDADKDDKDA